MASRVETTEKQRKQLVQIEKDMHVEDVDGTNFNTRKYYLELQKRAKELGISRDQVFELQKITSARRHVRFVASWRQAVGADNIDSVYFRKG